MGGVAVDTARWSADTVDTASEQYRCECEARTVMRWPREQRSTYYGQVREKRGEPAAQALIAEVQRQWRLAQGLAA